MHKILTNSEVPRYVSRLQGKYFPAGGLYTKRKQIRVFNLALQAGWLHTEDTRIWGACGGDVESPPSAPPVEGGCKARHCPRLEIAAKTPIDGVSISKTN